MPIANIESLFSLVNTLNKSEKRFFKVFANRLRNGKNALFINLFDTIEAGTSRTDQDIFRKLGFTSKTKYVNLKRHLFQQILKSLRILYGQSDPDIKHNEQSDYATILEKKGLIKESYELLERLQISNTRQYSSYALVLKENQLKLLQEFEDSAERENINLLSSDISKLRQGLQTEWLLSDLAQNLKNEFESLSYARNERERLLRRKSFDLQFNAINSNNLTLMQSVLLEQCYINYFTSENNQNKMLFHLIKQRSVIDRLLESKSAINTINFHNFYLILNTLFHLNQNEQYNHWFKLFNASIKLELASLTNNTLVKVSQYSLLASLDHGILNASPLREKTKVAIRDYEAQNSTKYSLDVHYKLALFFAYRGDYPKAIDYLNTILQSDKLKTELLLYTRLVHLLCHYRIFNFELVDNLIPSMRQAFNAHELMTKPVELSLAQIKKGVKALDFGLNDDIDILLTKLKELKTTSFQKNAFVYFDFIGWFESIKSNTTVMNIRIRQN